MSHRTTTANLVVMVVAMLLAAAPRIAAQSLGVSPPVVAAPGAGKELTLRGSVNGGYDANGTESEAAAPGLSFSPLFRRSSTHVGGDLQLLFSNSGRRVGFGAGWASAFRGYQAADLVFFSHHATAGVTAGLTRHITGWASVLGSYSPPYQVNVFPGAGPVTIGHAAVLPLDSSLSTSHLIAYGTSSGLTYNMTKRSSLTLGHEFREVRFGERAFAGRVQDGHAAFHVGLTKMLGLRLGYRYQQYDYADPTRAATTPVRANGFDIGLDFGAGHGLKLSRRTTANVAFGIATYTDQRVNRLQLRAVGNASLTHQLFRTWSVSLGYSRGLNFIDGFRLPIFSDSVRARVGGQLTRRVAAYGNLGYSVDQFQFGTATSSGSYRSHRGLLGIRANLTRQLDGFVHYVNYHRAFPDTALFLEGLSARDRQGVNGGLTFTLPLLGGQRPVPRGPS